MCYKQKCLLSISDTNISLYNHPPTILVKFKYTHGQRRKTSKGIKINQTNKQVEIIKRYVGTDTTRMQVG